MNCLRIQGRSGSSNLPRSFFENMEALAAATDVPVGVAPHSLRAVPLRELKADRRVDPGAEAASPHARGRADCGE